MKFDKVDWGFLAAFCFFASLFVLGVFFRYQMPPPPGPQLETTDIPDAHGVVCYTYGSALSCVKVTANSTRKER